MAAAVMEGNNSGEGRCKKHCETIQGLCDTCDELVCVKCMMGHHNGHTFTDLEARVGEKMELLQERVQEMRGRVPVLQQRVTELSIQDDKNQRDTEAVIASITQKGRLISLSLSYMTHTLWKKIGVVCGFFIYKHCHLILRSLSPLTSEEKGSVFFLFPMINKLKIT